MYCAKAGRLAQEDRTWLQLNPPDFTLCLDPAGVPQGLDDLIGGEYWQFGAGALQPGEYRASAVAELVRGKSRLGLSLWQVRHGVPTVLARGYTPIVPHSRKRSLARLYEIAPDLLQRAVANLYSPDGPALRSPIEQQPDVAGTGWLRFIGAMLKATARRWWEKLLFRQHWDIGLMEGRVLVPDATRMRGSRWYRGPVDGFWADPCFAADAQSPVLFVEEYPYRTGTGHLVRLSWAAGQMDVAPVSEPLLQTGSHLSFPRSYEHNGHRWLIPEMGAAGAQHAFALDAQSRLVNDTSIPVEGLSGVDPVLFAHAGRYWAFVSPQGRRANYQLALYMADDFLGPYRRHPASPVRIDPHGGRCAGPVVHDKGRLLRFGQVFGRHYGEAIDVFEITTLTPEHYAEHRIARIQPPPDIGVGMHTIDFSDNMTVVDRFRLIPVWRLFMARLSGQGV